MKPNNWRLRADHREYTLEQSMPNTKPGFYVTGGTVPRDAACYVTRAADNALLTSLIAGQFCYVLTARQMGKSSLMVRAVSRLSERGVTCVVLDLTAIGSNVTEEQWYDGLLNLVAGQLDMHDQLDDFWLSSHRIGPMQRWMKAIREVVLPNIRGPLAIFIDEIDYIRSLPFSSDEFLAGIRECYNRRDLDPELERLTFALFGVASPSDLIRDTRTTPFNIGVRVELSDFTSVEALPLTAGLPGNGLAALDRILYWTGGHPYLTQQLCQAAAMHVESHQGSSLSPRTIDDLCAGLFFTRTAKDQDDNLIYVRNRILNSELDLVAIITLYRATLRRHGVRDEMSSPLAIALKLSGVVGTTEGRLVVRNRVYRRVFDTSWVMSVIPDAEVRRQRRAFRNGLLVAGSVSATVVAMVAALAFIAVRNAQIAQRETSRANSNASRADKKTLEAVHNLELANRKAEDARTSAISAAKALAAAELQKHNTERAKRAADRSARNAERAAGRARAATLAEARALAAAKRSAADAANRAEDADRDLYVANMAVIQRDWDNNNIAHMRALVHQTSRRGRGTLEWGYWNRMCHLDLETVVAGGDIEGMAVSPDGTRIATGRDGGVAQVWDSRSGQLIHVLHGHTRKIWGVAFSRDGSRIGTVASDSTARVWDARSGTLLMTLHHAAVDLNGVSFSPDGSRLATGGANGEIDIWDLRSAQLVRAIRGHTRYVSSVQYSPDGSLIASGGGDFHARVWSATTGQKMIDLDASGFRQVSGVVFSPDGTRLATVCLDGYAKIWDVRSGRLLASSPKQPQKLNAVAFSPDGARIVAGSQDSTIEVWNATDFHQLLVLKGHVAPINAVAYSPDGKRIVSSSEDGTVKIWSATSDRTAQLLTRRDALIDAFNRRKAQQGGMQFGVSGVFAIRFAPRSRRILTGCEDGTAQVWDLDTGTLSRMITAHQGQVWAVAFSPDEAHIATSGTDGVRVWNAKGDAEQWRIPAPYIWSLCFSRDGSRLLIAGGYRIIEEWDVRTHARLRTFTGHKGTAVFYATYSPDSRLIASTCDDHTARVWDAVTGAQLLSFPADAPWVWQIAFSPDGSRVAAGAQGHDVRIWDVHSGRLIMKLVGHTDRVTSVLFTPDGRRIITGGADATVRIWDSQSGQELLDLGSPEDEGGKRGSTFTFIALAPGNNAIAAATNYYPGLKIWSCAP
jgi:WD40 repeat protein